MDNAQQSSRKPYRIGLLFRARSRSWFWGWGEPPAMPIAKAPGTSGQQTVSDAVMGTQTQARLGQEPATQRRISFAGFVFWRRPGSAEKSADQAFFSLSERVRQALDKAGPSLTPQPGRKWRPTRIAAPGQYFLGLVRRERS